MGKLAFVFPGQGAQQPGMGKDLYDRSPTARAVMDQAEGLMPGLLSLCFDGPMEALTRTDRAQPALFAVESALAAAAREMGLMPQAVAGFSLGEWSAVHDAGMLPFEEAFQLVRVRGQWMQACAESRPGSMSAVLRLTAEQVQEQLLAHPEVVAVNFNAPEQTVVAGPLTELAAFEAALKNQGMRSMRLNVGGAFHSPLMLSASDKLAERLTETLVAEPSVPVYANATGRPYQLQTAKETLALQLAQPVQWVQTIRELHQQGFDTFLELGPGRVLSGLIAKILPQATTLQAEDLQGLEAARDKLKENA